MLTDAQWGAMLRWMLALSMERVRGKRKRLKSGRVRVSLTLRPASYEPDWWHRRLEIPPEWSPWTLKFARRINEAARREDDTPCM